MLVGPFDPIAWTGLVFCTAPGRGFAFRFAFECNGERFDGYDFLNIVNEVGPCAPDGSYARVAFAGTENRSPTMILEWSRSGAAKCIGRVTMTRPSILEFRAYYPWDWTGSWSAAGGQAKATGSHVAIRGADGQNPEALYVTLSHTKSESVIHEKPTVSTEAAEYVLRFSMASDDTVEFIADAMRETPSSIVREPPEVDDGAVGRLLSAAAQRYADKRVAVDGHWNGLGASITNNLHWMVALKPEDGVRYTPAGRRWIFPRLGGGRDHWTVFCWDAFLNALELIVESPELATETLQSVIETQYENGNIPNWRGRYFGTRDRSQPPIGSFVALKLFLRTGNLRLLEKAFPALDKWSRWWRAPKGGGFRRDGNGNGLYEWGCDLDLLQPSPAKWENEADPHQFAAWESGQDDLPNWDDASWVSETETFDLESVDLNSLLALDFECLRRIAAILDLPEKAAEYGSLYDSLSLAINERLWDQDSGMYLDRLWDGRFTKRMAASNFYPLLAGIAPPDRAKQMLATLFDEQKFWGQYVLPSVSRDDPAFSDQQYWRGTIWPPTNYLVYQGLKRYRFDEAAAALAERSVSLILESWRSSQVCRENYDSRTGEGGGQKYQSWGPLFALTGIEEFIDVTPWDGLRIGSMFPPPSTTLDRLRIGNRQWRVTLSPSGLQLCVNGKKLLNSTKPIVLRYIELTSDRLNARLQAAEDLSLDVSIGSSNVSLAVDSETTVCNASDVRIPVGEHSVSIKATKYT